MKLNARKFWATFVFVYLLLLTVTCVSGCSAAWLSAVVALLPSLEAAVSAAIAFVAALEGKTVPASVSAAIQKIGDDIAAEVANVQQLIAAYKANASTGTLSQIQAVMGAIVTNLGNILTGASITDSATVSKLTALVGLAVAAAQAIAALIPLVTSAMQSGASRQVLEAQDKEAAAHIESAHSALQQAYVVIRTSPTQNADVNTALSVLPTSLP
jgi:hypothetical protein